VTAAVAAAGRVIVGPLGGFPAEDGVNRWLQDRRTPALDRTTWALSTYSDTVPTILTATALTAAAASRGRRSGWRRRGSGSGSAVGWEAARPLVAITLETAVFMSAAAVVGRDRPDVVRMDRPAPTSSFPSGHTGASTALHLTIADLVAEREGGTAAFVARAVRLVVPPLVGWSRLYRGMHHPSDVLVGLAVGVVEPSNGTSGAGSGTEGVTSRRCHLADR
jgi:membrane-associated phospholipid phosphatase